MGKVPEKQTKNSVDVKGKYISSKSLSTFFLGWLAIIIPWATILVLEVLKVTRPFGENFTIVDKWAFIGFSLIIDFFVYGIFSGILALAFRVILLKLKIVKGGVKALFYPVSLVLFLFLPFLSIRATILGGTLIKRLMISILFAWGVAFLLLFLANRLWKFIRIKPVIKLVSMLSVLFFVISISALVAHSRIDMPQVRWFVLSQSVQKPDMFDLFESNNLLKAVGVSPIVSKRVNLFKMLDDPDGDNYSSPWLTGGNDCNGFDPLVHPGAFDINGNGIDEDCYNGDYDGVLPDRTFVLSDLTRRPKPDVVLLFVDALRSDRVGAYGYSRNTTPIIDKMSRDGILFEKTFSVAPSTQAVVSSIFSGLNVLEHGTLYTLDDFPSGSIESLFEVFQKNGYQTLYVDDNFAVSENPLLKAGVDTFLVENVQQNEQMPPYESWISDYLTDADVDRPFFALIHFSGVHQPFIQLPEYLSLVDPNPGAVLRFPPDTTLSNEQRQQIETMNFIADGEIRRIDTLIGKITSVIEEKREGSALYVVFGDHGEAWGENEVRWGDHGTLYEYDMRVPWIITPVAALPEGISPGRVAAQVSIIDMFPTLIDLLGLEFSDSVEQQISGNSAVPLMQGEIHPGWDIIQVLETPGYKAFDTRLEIALRTPDNLKFHYFLKENRKELFDLSATPFETDATNLYFTDRERAKDLENKLMQIYQEQLHRYYAKYGSVTQRVLSDRERQALIELGYIK